MGDARSVVLTVVILRISGLLACYTMSTSKQLQTFEGSQFKTAQSKNKPTQKIWIQIMCTDDWGGKPKVVMYNEQDLGG
jgi:hypothetical protein